MPQPWTEAGLGLPLTVSEDARTTIIRYGGLEELIEVHHKHPVDLEYRKV
jgi:hypothetical protein